MHDDDEDFVGDPLARLIDAARQRGIDLHVADTPPVLHPTGWIMEDAAGWHTDRVSRQLAAIIPAGFQTARMHDCDDRIRSWLTRHLSEPRTFPALRIHGGVGRGKTWAAWALVRAVAEDHAAHGRSLDFRFITGVELNDQLRPKPDGSHAYTVDRLINTGLLVLDDLGAGKPTEWITEQILRIVNHRHTNRLPTIYTSNQGLDDLATQFDARVASRIAQAEPVIVVGPDQRRSPRR